ncbi:MAG: hypothetical protein J2P25_13100 [Nocardiopsaceae bacterium]|nr:hypothetical protein [Nocardiopsaceae bacterium]
MSRRSIIIFVWLSVGAAAAGQRGYYTGQHAHFGCSGSATIAVTIAAGPLNYIGVDPSVACKWPSPTP